MIKKIKIKKMEKTTAYIDNEWAVVFSRRDKMLSESHWISTSDSQLTMQCKVRFSLWRAMLRFLVREDWADPPALAAQLDWMETKRPSLEYIKAGEFSYMLPYELNTRTLEDLKTTAIMLLYYHVDIFQKYLSIKLKHPCGLSIVSINHAKHEIQDAKTYELVVSALCKFYQEDHHGY